MIERALERAFLIAASGLVVGLVGFFVAPSDPWRVALLAAWILALFAVLRERRS